MNISMTCMSIRHPPQALAALVSAMALAAGCGRTTLPRLWDGEHATSARLDLPLARVRPAPGHHAFHILTEDARGDWRSFGRMDVSESRVVERGVPAIRRVIVYDYGARGAVVDTTWSVAASLAPIAERTYKRSGIIHLDFAGREVRGKIGPSTATRPLDVVLPQPAINTTDLDLVARSLELDAGAHVTLPLYDPEFGGFRIAPVTIDGPEPMATASGPRDAWVVSILDPQATSVYRIATDDRSLLRADVTVPSRNARFVIEAIAGP